MQADMHDNTAHILLHEFSELRSRFDEFCYRQGRREVQVQEDAEADAVSAVWMHWCEHVILQRDGQSAIYSRISATHLDRQ